MTVWLTSTRQRASFAAAALIALAVLTRPRARLSESSDLLPVTSDSGRSYAFQVSIRCESMYEAASLWSSSRAEPSSVSRVRINGAK